MGFWDYLYDSGQFLWDYAQYLPLLVVLVLVPLLVTGHLGRNYGVPLLFWHERPYPRFMAGAAVTLLFVHQFFSGYLLDWAPRYQASQHFQPPAAATSVRPLGLEGFEYAYLPVLTLTLLAVFALLGALGWLRRRRDAAQQATGPAHRGLVLWFGLGVLSALLLTAGLLVLVNLFLKSDAADYAKEWMGRLAEALDHPAKSRWDQEPTGEAELHVVGLIVLGLLIVCWFAYLLDRRGRYVTPVMSLCTLLAALTAVYGSVVFWAYGSRALGFYAPLTTLVVVLLLVLWLVGGVSRYKDRFDHVGDYARPKRLESYEPDRQAARSGEPAGAMLRQQRRDDEGVGNEEYRQEPLTGRPLVVLCVSGGATRAAVWVAAVLRELNDKIPGFSHHVRLITGASGGMVGAAYHVAALQRPPGWPALSGGPCTFDIGRARWGEDSNEPTEERMLQRLADDNLSPLVHRLIFNDLPGMFVPWPLRTDRGHALENAWKDTLAGGWERLAGKRFAWARWPALDIPLRDFWAGEQEGWRPSLVFSPMIVEDGRRLLISNLDLSWLTTNCWQALRPGGTGGASRSAVQFFDLFPDSALRLGTAVRMSAAYPYVSPAAVLPTDPRRRVVDAGYYDNYGVNLAARWLYHQRPWLAQHRRRVLLVHIRDGLLEKDLHDLSRPPDRSWLLTRGLEELLSPLDAVLAARSAVMSFRNDEQLEVLSDAMKLALGPDGFTTVLFENPREISMSWYLPAQERQELCDAVRSASSIQQRMELVVQWWQGTAAKPAPGPAVPGVRSGP
jgi:hypothetical protein